MVRKEGSNKGRWFYTCQEPKESSCGFFLWDDDAAGREMKAVVTNSRSEPAAAFEMTTAQDANTTDKRTVAGHIEASEKWIAKLVKQEEDEFGDWPLSVNDEVSIVRTVSRTAMPEPSHPETPRKVVKVGEFSTPGSKRKRDEADGLPTPAAGRTDEDVFTTPSATRLKDGAWDGNEKCGLMSPSVTPTPSRFHDFSHPAITGKATFDLKDYDITQEVMEILHDQSLEEEARVKVRQAVNRYALKTQGIARGRDLTRMALKTRDTKIAELEQHITALENEREVDKLVITHFKTDMAHSLSRGGQGRGKTPFN